MASGGGEQGRQQPSGGTVPRRGCWRPGGGAAQGRPATWLSHCARSAMAGGGGSQTHVVVDRGNALTRVLEPAAVAEAVSERAELRTERLECLPVSDG